MMTFLSTIDPNNIDEALSEDSWMIVMEEESNNSLKTGIGILFPLLRIKK